METDLVITAQKELIRWWSWSWSLVCWHHNGFSTRFTRTDALHHESVREHAFPTLARKSCHKTCNCKDDLRGECVREFANPRIARKSCHKICSCKDAHRGVCARALASSRLARKLCCRTYKQTFARPNECAHARARTSGNGNACHRIGTGMDAPPSAQHSACPVLRHFSMPVRKLCKHISLSSPPLPSSRQEKLRERVWASHR